jgi:2-hydroxychromene-2-carboxylate isomerase
LLKGDALIRANLGVDPAGLEDEKWAQLFAEALWVEQWRLKNQAELLAALFGRKND